MTGVNLVHVPSNGSAPAWSDMLTGRVPAGFVLLDSALPYIKGGRLKVLGLISSKRSAIYPQYPTSAESLPGYALESILGVVAPSGLPAPAAKPSRDLQTMANLPAVREHVATEHRDRGFRRAEHRCVHQPGVEGVGVCGEGVGGAGGLSTSCGLADERLDECV